MSILTIGALNLDFVYSVNHTVLSGETIPAFDFETLSGGKGLNQSVALARSGADVFLAGFIGSDGDHLLKLLKSAGVKTDYIKKADGRNGHAIIQVAKNGENSIVIYPGTNALIGMEYIDSVLSNFTKGDILLCQNEIPHVAYSIKRAKENGMTVAFNPSPVLDEPSKYPLDLVDILIVNEIEGIVLSSVNTDDYSVILDSLYAKYPHATIVLTLGKNGVLLKNSQVSLSHPAYTVNVVDTTAAGDTFTGFFLAALSKNKSYEKCLELASKASAIAVGSKGAAVSIPMLCEVESIGGELECLKGF